MIGLKKKFATDQFSNISTYFQFDYTSQKKESSNVKSDIDSNVACATTDKKRNVSGDKLGSMTGQKTVGSTDASTTKKAGFQFNQQKQAQASQHVSAFDPVQKNPAQQSKTSGTVSNRAHYINQHQSSQ